jgi:hypothetical protein
MYYYLRDKLRGFNYSEGETEETAQRHEQYFLVAKLISQATKEGVQTTQSFPLQPVLLQRASTTNLTCLMRETSHSDTGQGRASTAT